MADVAPKMLEAVRQVHSTGHIHRDVKPDNFRVHEGKVYITDFGTIQQIVDDNGQFKAKYEDGAFVGTIPYFSVNAQQQKTQSFRDDLESLGYAILNMLVGNQNLWFELNGPYAKDFIDSKNDFRTSNSDDPRLKSMRTYLRKVNSLSFEAVPDYASLSGVLSKLN